MGSMSSLIVTVDPRYDSPMCQGCGVRRAAEVHHMEHKAMGGRKGAAKTHSERAENKIKLCRVCHAADHARKVIESDGFWCGLCPKVRQCRVGAKIAKLPYQHLSPLWNPYGTSTIMV
jgi:hypothetical protein